MTPREDSGHQFLFPPRFERRVVPCNRLGLGAAGTRSGRIADRRVYNAAQPLSLLHGGRSLHGGAGRIADLAHCYPETSGRHAGSVKCIHQVFLQRPRTHRRQAIRYRVRNVRPAHVDRAGRTDLPPEKYPALPRHKRHFCRYDKGRAPAQGCVGLDTNFFCS